MPSVMLREAPGRGRVYACPHCGSVALLQCYHDETGPVRTQPMNAVRAAWLRGNGPLKPRRMEFTCDGCGHHGPYEVGMTIGGRALCAACSGRSPEQVRIARRRLAPLGDSHDRGATP